MWWDHACKLICKWVQLDKRSAMAGSAAGQVQSTGPQGRAAVPKPPAVARQQVGTTANMSEEEKRDEWRREVSGGFRLAIISMCN